MASKGRQTISVGGGTGLEVSLYGETDEAGNTIDFELTHDIGAISVDSFGTYF